MRRLALASLVGNVGIVITGGAVRLTGSGLGCPTWPRCTSRSYVTTTEMGVHGVVEFSNRMLTFVVGLLAAACVAAALAQRPRRGALTRLSLLVLAGIPAQAVIGGITVLTDLNPWVVSCHFLASIAVLAAAYALWQRSREGDAPPAPVVPGPLRGLLGSIVAASAAVIVVGAVVTGSGPHAGDAKARRTGLDLVQITQLHADLVFLLIGLSVAAWFALRAVGAPPPAVRAAAVLLAVEAAQAVIGFVQYFTHLPVLAVGLHMAGACAVWVAALALWYASRERGAAATPRAPLDERSPALAR